MAWITVRLLGVLKVWTKFPARVLMLQNWLSCTEVIEQRILHRRWTIAMVDETWVTLAKGDVIGEALYWTHVPISSWQAWWNQCTTAGSNRLKALTNCYRYDYCYQSDNLVDGHQRLIGQWIDPEIRHTRWKKKRKEIRRSMVIEVWCAKSCSVSFTTRKCTNHFKESG